MTDSGPVCSAAIARRSVTARRLLSAGKGPHGYVQQRMKNPLPGLVWPVACQGQGASDPDPMSFVCFALDFDAYRVGHLAAALLATKRALLRQWRAARTHGTVLSTADGYRQPQNSTNTPFGGLLALVYPHRLVRGSDPNRGPVSATAATARCQCRIPNWCPPGTTRKARRIRERLCGIPFCRGLDSGMRHAAS
jgi:hypothetical protein